MEAGRFLDGAGAWRLPRPPVAPPRPRGRSRTPRWRGGLRVSLLRRPAHLDRELVPAEIDGQVIRRHLRVAVIVPAIAEMRVAIQDNLPPRIDNQRIGDRPECRA